MWAGEGSVSTDKLVGSSLGKCRRVSRGMRNMRVSEEPWTEGKLGHLVTPWPGAAVPHSGSREGEKGHGAAQDGAATALGAWETGLGSWEETFHKDQSLWPPNGLGGRNREYATWEDSLLSLRAMEGSWEGRAMDKGTPGPLAKGVQSSQLLPPPNLLHTARHTPFLLPTECSGRKAS